MAKIKIFTNKIKTFFQKEIYSIDTANVNPAYRFFINLYRVITFAITDFFKDDCTIRAASLTYLVTLSFIPALIVGLFVLRIFNIYQNIFILIFDWMEKNAPFYEPMVRQILNIADNTDLASFGIIGVISTLISASLILHNIQKSLIKIWRVKIRTSIPRVAVNYIALLILIPVSIGISFTLITYSSIALYYLPAIVRILISWVTPVIAMSLLVLFSYVLVPQTKVNWSNALISSVLVAIAIITLFSVYFKLNINVKNYKQIFDSDKYKTEYIVREVNLLNNKNELADIKLDRISYRIIEDEGTGISAATYEREVISSNALFFTNFAPNIYEQVRKYNFQLDDIVTITSENSLLTSIEPAELSSASAFAQIPVLLLLLYIVWIIILFGAELTYSLQYFRSYGVDVTNIKLSFAEKEMIALEFMHTITYRFINNKKCMSMYDLARDLRVAPSVLNDIADSLEEAQYIVKIVNGSTTSYTLACPPEHKYKNIIYQNKAISAKDYNTTLLALVESKKK